MNARQHACMVASGAQKDAKREKDQALPRELESLRRDRPATGRLTSPCVHSTLAAAPAPFAHTVVTEGKNRHTVLLYCIVQVLSKGQLGAAKL